MNKIPKMTHPLGSCWKQPDPESILIDDTHAVMTAAVYDQLLRYDGSMPTGVYDGKMWKSRNHLVWFGPGLNPLSCTINHREVLLA
jgi:hypothetical protein